jgi:hypothetical protein
MPQGIMSRITGFFEVERREQSHRNVRIRRAFPKETLKNQGFPEEQRWSQQWPVPPSRLNASIPLDLETICLKCLEKEPAKRYVTAEALAADLAPYLAGEPIRARPVGFIEAAARWSVRLARQNPIIATWAGVSPLLLFLRLDDAALTGAAAVAMTVRPRARSIAVMTGATVFALYGFFGSLSLIGRRIFEISGFSGFLISLSLIQQQIHRLSALTILWATRGAFIAIGMVSFWAIGGRRRPLVLVLLTLCAVFLWFGDLFGLVFLHMNERMRLGAVRPDDPIYATIRTVFSPAVSAESVCGAVLIGLGLGALMGFIPRRLSEATRGDPAVTMFGAMAGLLGIMVFFPIETIMRDVYFPPILPKFLAVLRSSPLDATTERIFRGDVRHMPTLAWRPADWFVFVMFFNLLV